LCVEFESAWRRGGSPELAQFLARLPPASGTAGVECLLEIELAARRERGECPTWDRYSQPLCEWTEDAVGVWKRVSSVAPGAAEALRRAIPLPDRFELLEELARGGMGTVFKVRHRHRDRLIAVKVLHRRLTDHPEAVERFRGEIRLLAALNHPGI